MIPQPIALLVIVAGLLTSRTGTLYAQILMCLIGGASALELSAIGGAVITPPFLFLSFFMVRAFQEWPRDFWQTVPRGVAWFIAAVLWGVLAAIIVPRALEGALEVITQDRGGGASGTTRIPLRPVSGNITQSVYALGDVGLVLATNVLLRKPARHTTFVSAVVTLGLLNVLAAVTSVAAYYAGVFDPISLVRTAYVTFDTYEGSNGLVRIQGTASETSAFSYFSLTLFAFCGSVWVRNQRRWLAAAAAGATLLLLLLSTSSTAYAGLGLYLVLALSSAVGDRVLRVLARRPELSILPVAFLALAVLAVLLEWPVVDKVVEIVDSSLLKKMDSESGRARGEWNSAAWHAFVDSFGLGVGLGSARASSYPLVLLSNFGLAGTGAYVCFAAHVVRARTGDSELQTAARQGALAAFCAATISATVFELGVLFYMFAAAALTPLPRDNENVLGGGERK
jgi:O-Antigen ligase